MSEVVSHKCMNCGSALRFSVGDQALKCVSCDSVFTQEEVERYSKMIEEYEANPGKSEIRWDVPSEQMGLDDKSGYRCESCGGSIIVDKSVAATKCPYCENPALLAQNLSGMLKPDVIIPFAVKREEMKERLKNFLKGKFLVPRRFRDNHRIEQSSGVYVPFWLFDVAVDARVVFDATRSRSYTSGDYRITETSHYKCYRRADFDFENIPADASEAMKDEYMDSIEPFHMKDTVPFDGMYMVGFMADKYTVESKDCVNRINTRVENTCISELKDTVKGYDTCVANSSTINNRKDGRVKYAMMPVWIMATRYKGKVYEFVMNGQTGKVVGTVPISLGRCAAMVGILTAIGTAISAAVAFL